MNIEARLPAPVPSIEEHNGSSNLPQRETVAPGGSTVSTDLPERQARKTSSEPDLDSALSGLQSKLRKRLDNICEDLRRAEQDFDSGEGMTSTEFRGAERDFRDELDKFVVGAGIAYADLAIDHRSVPRGDRRIWVGKQLNAFIDDIHPRGNYDSDDLEAAKAEALERATSHIASRASLEHKSNRPGEGRSIRNPRRQRHPDPRKLMIAGIKARFPHALAAEICNRLDVNVGNSTETKRRMLAPLKCWTDITGTCTWTEVYEHPTTHDRVRGYINKIPPAQTRKP
jgi:hypothetical protein